MMRVRGRVGAAFGLSARDRAAAQVSSAPRRRCRRHRGFRSFAAAAAFAAFVSVSSASAAETARNCGGRVATFDFGEQHEDVAGPVASITDDQQEEFKAAFCRAIGQIETWAGQHRWLLPMHAPHLQVHVADTYVIGRSLVPQWRGKHGRIELPSYRVAVGEATIVHELAHVYFANANRMLAEGFAVYLQHRLGENGAFPNFNEDLHQMLKCQVSPSSRRSIRLEQLDKITTPTRLTLRLAGDKVETDGWNYVFAGSFVQYLIEEHGPDRAELMDKFRALYARTPLVPLQRNSGSADRWKAVYGSTLAELEQSWKAFVETKTCP